MIYYAQRNHGVSLQNFEISTKEKPPAIHRRLFFEQHFPFESDRLVQAGRNRAQGPHARTSRPAVSERQTSSEMLAAASLGNMLSQSIFIRQPILQI
ncbi:hypothetical protein K6X12_08720 [Xanthomonas euvesicatoria pv. allii]|uniref:hypothetical protein n=1 Tax=Xanthomonas euvesicatoria TaxID=456327 RepID=UPI002405F531|nr:hypothetical protein [Xanthomonas euvesicatoria]MCP3039066.1 hypothetical protein [Xanthomonas euvesicatoria pv. allii]MCP3051165.1 hypothetical protein [Xanthomonas euvesicatoria pv. allii]